MKFLILIILLSSCTKQTPSDSNTNCVANQTGDITHQEQEKIIANIQKYFAQDQETSLYTITNFIIINTNNNKIIEIPIESSGKTIIWENKYGVTSYEYTILLLKKSEISTIPSTNIQNLLLSLYNETNIEYLQKTIESIFGSFDSIFYQGGIFSTHFESPEILYETFKLAETSPELKNALIELVIPDNPEKRKNYLLNSILFAISVPNSMDDNWKAIGFYSDDI
ncbi:MAG: hypothetical protein ACRCTQ_02945 [Brevinemataceae bacterium]